jgi:hypothetical protein
MYDNLILLFVCTVPVLGLFLRVGSEAGFDLKNFGFQHWSLIFVCLKGCRQGRHTVCEDSLRIHERTNVVVVQDQNSIFLVAGCRTRNNEMASVYIQLLRFQCCGYGKLNLHLGLRRLSTETI